MSESVICTRSFEFAGTSIGANAEEAQEAQTEPDFIARLSVSRKEARETQYWLRMSVQAGIATTDELGWAIKEIGEIRAMLIAAIRTARPSSARGEKPK